MSKYSKVDEGGGGGSGSDHSADGDRRAPSKRRSSSASSSPAPPLAAATSSQSEEGGVGAIAPASDAASASSTASSAPAVPGPATRAADVVISEAQQIVSTLVEQGQQHLSYLQQSLPHFGMGGGGGDGQAQAQAQGQQGGGGGAGAASFSSYFMSSLQQHPAPSSSSSSAHGAASSSPPGAPPLTRTLSTPESSLGGHRRRPLQGCEGRRAAREEPSSGGKDDDEEDLDLKQTYPLLLQRSASSAFGSPATSSSNSKKLGGSGRAFRGHGGGAGRTHSNSGSSDPGCSAFHPVWSCKSLSSGGSISGSNVGSDIGSAVSSTVASSLVARSVHSDPLPSEHATPKKTKKSPWRRVVARMKKGGSSSGNSNSGSKKPSTSFRRSLSGRENPARPNLSEDEEVTGHNNGSATSGSAHEMIMPASMVVAGSDEGVVLDLSNLSLGEKDQLSGGSKNDKKKKALSVGLKKKSKSSSATSRSSEGAGSDRKNGEDESTEQKGRVQYQQYADPGVALYLSDDDSDNDDEASIEPIGRDYIPLDENDIVPPSRVAPRRQQHRNNVLDSAVEDPCDGVEVVHSTSTPTARHARPQSSDAVGGAATVEVFSPRTSTIEEEGNSSSNSPPSVERVAVVVEEAAETDEEDLSFPYHPLGEQKRRAHCEGSGDTVGHNLGSVSAEAAAATAGIVPIRLKYRSPQRTLQHSHANAGSSSNSTPSSSQDSPDSRLSGGSPASRISSTNSRMSATVSSGGDRTINTLHSAEGSLLVVDGTDYEVREANRRSIRGRIGSPLAGGGGPDGSDTVFSSSTTSSNYNAYLCSSPRPLRDGATMPVQRFFHSGNVAMSPSPQRGGMGVVYPAASAAGGSSEDASSASNISKLLVPRKLSRIGASGMSSSTRDSATHSPHTVSSNSVSLANSSSSGSSETKKPLKFVAYEIREERESSPFDEPPVSRYSAAGAIAATDAARDTPMASCSSLIKPRIQQSQRRPPMIQRTTAYKPPQSPRKQDTISRARTPTRTPPPSSFNNAMPSSGANTPCSPPVIVDGPVASGSTVLMGDSSLRPTRPYVVRRSMDRGISGRGMFLIPPTAPSYRPQQQQHPPVPPSAVGGTLENPTEATSANTGAQELLFTAANTEGTAGATNTVIMVSPDRPASQTLARRENENNGKSDSVAIVSPEKGF